MERVQIQGPWESLKPFIKTKVIQTIRTTIGLLHICTLVSSLGKLFTSILNNFSDETDLVTKSQAGFRAGYSTQDNIFILYSLITLYLSMKKKLFCCFINFKKAFDTIWRARLWQTLINSNIHGEMFKIFFSFYDTSVDTEMCCPKGKCGCQYFISLTLKK